MKRICYSPGDLINGIEFIADCDPLVSPSRVSRRALFRCSCGNEFNAVIRSVKSGNTKSCGCYGRKTRSDRFTTHGKRSHPLYSVWCGIKTRCNNKSRPDYKYYGGRGICISGEFSGDFNAWFYYVISLDGYSDRVEKNLTIDRINNNKNYERGNLRWATKLQQVKNRN